MVKITMVIVVVPPVPGGGGSPDPHGRNLWLIHVTNQLLTNQDDPPSMARQGQSTPEKLVINSSHLKKTESL